MTTRLSLALALAFAAAVPALAQDYPKLKPGLWEVTVAQLGAGKDEPPMKSSMCLDDATAKEMYNASQGMMAGCAASSR